VRLEALHPRFQDSDFSTLSMLWTLALDREVAPGRFVVVELPYTRFHSESADDASSTFGNPYVGWHGKERDSYWHGEFGLRFPMTSDDEPAQVLAILSDQIDNPEAWLPDIVSFRAEACYVRQQPQSMGVKIGFGPIVWLDTGDQLSDEFEVFFHGHGHVLFVARETTVGLGLSGRFLLTTNGGATFHERTMQEISLFASRNVGTWRPAVRVRFPWDTVLDEYAETSIAVSLGYTF